MCNMEGERRIFLSFRRFITFTYFEMNANMKFVSVLNKISYMLGMFLPPYVLHICNHIFCPVLCHVALLHHIGAEKMLIKLEDVQQKI